jgi:hypothetical protein
MISTELEYAEKRMRQKWYDLVMTEQKGASMPVLERMYNAYMLAVEEYNRCSASAPSEPTEQPEQASPTSTQRATSPAHPVHNGKRRRKAS